MPEQRTGEESPPTPTAPQLAVGDPADYVVLFLDFMGQKEHLSRWRKCAESGYPGGQKHSPQTGKTGLDEAVQKSAEVVAALFKTTRDHFLKSLIYDELATPTDFRLASIQFSDTVVFYGKMEPNGHVGTRGLFLIYSALIAASSVTHNSFLLDSRVRGAITIGQAVDGITEVGDAGEASSSTKKVAPAASDNFFYGPVLERAHFLESRVADYPRILVDCSVVNYLNNLQLMSPNWPEFDKNYRDILDKSLRLVPGGVDGDEVQGLDGFRVLDWAGRNFFDVANPEWREWFAKHLPGFIQKTKEAQSNALKLYLEKGDDEQFRVAGKHARLAHYLEARLPIWEGCQASGDH